MPSLSTERVAQALAAVVRETLKQGEAADVPELGTFRVAHRSSAMEDGPNGDTVMHPPRDEVVFEPHVP